MFSRERERERERQRQAETDTQGERRHIFCLGKCSISVKDIALRYLEMLTAALFPAPKEALKDQHINHPHSKHSVSNGKR